MGVGMEETGSCWDRNGARGRREGGVPTWVGCISGVYFPLLLRGSEAGQDLGCQAPPFSSDVRAVAGQASNPVPPPPAGGAGVGAAVFPPPLSPNRVPPILLRTGPFPCRHHGFAPRRSEDSHGGFQRPDLTGLKNRLNGRLPGSGQFLRQPRA